MKKLAQVVLYVSSIVLAIGIGMYQVGAVGNPELPLGSAGNCTQVVTFPDCPTQKCGTMPVPEMKDSGGDVKDCVANIVPNGWCLSDDDDCSASAPTLSCNTDCE